MTLLHKCYQFTVSAEQEKQVKKQTHETDGNVRIFPATHEIGRNQAKTG